jgi:hypothetical protein
MRVKRLRRNCKPGSQSSLFVLRFIVKVSAQTIPILSHSAVRILQLGLSIHQNNSLGGDCCTHLRIGIRKLSLDIQPFEKSKPPNSRCAKSCKTIDGCIIPLIYDLVQQQRAKFVH